MNHLLLRPRRQVLALLVRCLSGLQLFGAGLDGNDLQLIRYSDSVAIKTSTYRYVMEENLEEMATLSRQLGGKWIENEYHLPLANLAREVYKARFVKWVGCMVFFICWLFYQERKHKQSLVRMVLSNEGIDLPGNCSLPWETIDLACSKIVRKGLDNILYLPLKNDPEKVIKVSLGQSYARAHACWKYITNYPKMSLQDRKKNGSKLKRVRIEEGEEGGCKVIIYAYSISWKGLLGLFYAVVIYPCWLIFASTPFSTIDISNPIIYSPTRGSYDPSHDQTFDIGSYDIMFCASPASSTYFLPSTYLYGLKMEDKETNEEFFSWCHCKYDNGKFSATWLGKRNFTVLDNTAKALFQARWLSRSDTARKHACISMGLSPEEDDMATIGKAYKACIAKCHPDKERNEQEKRRCEEKSKALNAHHDLLTKILPQVPKILAIETT